jgi:uncharacterized membrane protein YcaP (DUF421 family)
VDLALRAIVLFFVVFILTRVIGRRELSSLEPFDLILLIILGDAIQQGLTQDDYSVTGAVIVVSVFAALQVSISYISFRSRRLRPILQGEPIVLVQDGELIESNLKRERLTAGEVAEAARQEQIASLKDVQWAVLETSGKISFIPKSSS